MPLDKNGDSPNLRHNATVGHCVVCGDAAPRQLCRPCQKDFTDPETGKLNAAVRELQQRQDAEAHEQARNNNRVMRGTPQRSGRRGGRPQSHGVSFVRLEH